MPHPLLRAAVGLVAGAFLLAACGDDTTPASDSDARTVEIDMVDIAFRPETLKVDEGETVRFVFTNRGQVVHDAFIGDRHAQAQHEAEMRGTVEGDDGHGGHAHEGDDAVTVEPGDSAELTYTFEETGTVEIGCHQPGHYASGMKVTVDVT